MMNGLSNFFFGNQQDAEAAAVADSDPLDTVNIEDDWVFVGVFDKPAVYPSAAAGAETELSDEGFCNLRERSVSPATTLGEQSSETDSDDADWVRPAAVQAGAIDSWLVTPPPCFTGTMADLDGETTEKQMIPERSAFSLEEILYQDVLLRPKVDDSILNSRYFYPCWWKDVHPCNPDVDFESFPSPAPNSEHCSNFFSLPKSSNHLNDGVETHQPLSLDDQMVCAVLGAPVMQMDEHRHAKSRGLPYTSMRLAAHVDKVKVEQNEQIQKLRRQLGAKQVQRSNMVKHTYCKQYRRKDFMHQPCARVNNRHC